MPTIIRESSDQNGTFGILYDDEGNNLCHTLELPWDENKTADSCIPPDIYNVIPYSSPKFDNVWELLRVQGRSDILIHYGNTIMDTKGCILVGDSLGKIGNLPAILNSRNTLTMLKSILPDTFQLKIIGVEQ